jgi:hypothetical protein
MRLRVGAGLLRLVDEGSSTNASFQIPFDPFCEAWPHVARAPSQVLDAGRIHCTAIVMIWTV